MEHVQNGVVRLLLLEVFHELVEETFIQQGLACMSSYRYIETGNSVFFKTQVEKKSNSLGLFSKKYCWTILVQPSHK